MTRFGAVDCGTNSIRMLITDVREVDGVLEMTELHRVMEIVRLGEGVDATGRLADAALERVRAALLSIGSEALVELAAAPEAADVGCQFCGKHYAFSPEELREMAAESEENREN